MNMKKFVAGLFMTVSLISFASCEMAEQGYTEEIYYDNIFTVNKHTVSPEFKDTSYMMSNMDEHPLQTGDRARMILRYYFDAYSGRMPQWTIHKVVETIPTRDIVAKSEIDSAAFVTPFVGLDYYELMDRYYNPVWVWKNRLNMNIIYKGVADDAEFAMAVRGISDGLVELELYAKAKSVGEVTTTKLLTFDLADVEGLILPEQQALVSDVDSLKTKIYFKLLDDKGVVKEGNIMGGKFRNPFKK